MRCVLLVAIVAMPAFGGEKAAISVPSKPSAAANPALTRPPSTSFQPLDNNSSIGGVVDAAVVPSAPTVNVPDAKTQKELIERLDRRKNWLLDDSPSRGRAAGEVLMMDSMAEVDYSTNPQRPQTALERRLKGGSRTEATEAAERDARQRAYFEDRENNPDTDYGLDSFQPNVEINGLTPVWSGMAAPQKATPGYLSGGNGTAAASGTSIAGDLARPNGLDSMTQERLDRYERTFGLEDSTSRTSSMEAAVDRSRSRESRSQIMGQPASRDAGLPLDSNAAPTAAPASIARSSLTPPEAPGGISNPYSAAPAPPEPYVSPAEKMLRAPPVQIPRFRP